MIVDFTKLDLTTKSMVTEDLLESALYNTPLAGLGYYFLKIESVYNINALYLCAHALLETSFGTSDVANYTKNLYSIKEGNVGSEVMIVFNNYEESINLMAQLTAASRLKKIRNKNLRELGELFYYRTWSYDMSVIMNKIIIKHERSLNRG